MVDLIEFIDFSRLDEDSQRIVQEITAKYSKKIQSVLDNATSATLHIKETKKSDHPSHYSSKLKIMVPKKMLEVEKEDHDLAKLLHKTFEALKNEIEHYLS